MSDERRELIKALAVASYPSAWDNDTPPNVWLSAVVADADYLLAALGPQSSSAPQSAADATSVCNWVYNHGTGRYDAQCGRAHPATNAPSAIPDDGVCPYCKCAVSAWYTSAPSHEGAGSATAASGGDVCIWTWQTGDFYKRACNGELREKDVWAQHSSCKNCGKPIQRAAEPAARVTDEMVTRFLGWRLPDDFAPDGGVTFDREHCAKWPGYWPVGTNLLTAPQAKAMLEHVLSGSGECVCRWKRETGRIGYTTPHGEERFMAPKVCGTCGMPVVFE